MLVNKVISTYVSTAHGWIENKDCRKVQKNKKQNHDSGFDNDSPQSKHKHNQSPEIRHEKPENRGSDNTSQIYFNYYNHRC
jgi:hypothetical protein